MDEKTLKELREYYDNTILTAEIAEAKLNTEVVESPMVGITVRVPAELLEQVREAAASEGIKTTALIRKWIEIEVDIRSRAASTHCDAYENVNLVVGSVLFSNADDDSVHKIEIPRDYALSA